MNNEEIENVNDRELFSEVFENPINPLLTHIVPPFVDKKDPMFHLQINGEATWKWREAYGHPSIAFVFLQGNKSNRETTREFKATRNGFCSVAVAVAITELLVCRISLCSLRSLTTIEL